MRFLGHSTVRVELGGRVVLTDPLLTGRVGPLRRVGPPPSRADWADADLVLVSHLHGDHLHLPSLRLLAPSARIVVPRGAGAWLRARGVRGVEELRPRRGAGRRRPARARRARAHSGHRFGPRSTAGPQAARWATSCRRAHPRVRVRRHRPVRRHGRVRAGRRRAAAGLGLGADARARTPRPGPRRGRRRPVRPRVVVPVHWGSFAPAGLTAVPGGPGARMRRLLVNPPRVFAATVAAGPSGAYVAVTEPGERVSLPVPR